jgi:hypothetical protein
MKNIILLFAFIVSFQINAQKKVLKNKTEINRLTEKVSNMFKDEKVAEAFNEMMLYWPLSEEQIVDFKEKSITDIAMIKTQYGNPSDIVKVKEEILGDIALKQIYFVRYDLSAITLEFIFYKNNRGWILNRFNWNPSFDKVFK